jgi:hypothetical protein
VGAVGQEIAPSKDSSCLVGSAASAPALGLSELVSERSDDLLEHAERRTEERIIGGRSAPRRIELLIGTGRNTVGKNDSFVSICSGRPVLVQ